MKKILLALSISVLFGIFFVNAQTKSVPSFSVKGIVMDSLTNEPVPYATLTIMSTQAPQKAIKTIACEMDGKFETALPAAGGYLLSIQFVGSSAQKGFTVSDAQKKVDLGKVYMKETQQNLGEVTITAQKPLVKVEIDKITYSLEDDPESKVSNTLDMLRKVPMVTVDGEDKIQLKGSSNYKIYMNGKPSNLLSNNPSEVLKSMPASSVKNIEVITDPGAKYDAEGIGGIINIITSKNGMQGFTGTVRADAGTLGSMGAGTYISAKIGKLGLTGNFNYNRQNGPWNPSILYQENYLAGGQKINQEGRSKYKGPFQYGYLEGSYEIDTLNLISLGINRFYGKIKAYGEYDVRTSVLDSLISHYQRNTLSEQTFGSTDVSLDYQHSTKKKDELLTFSYRYSNSPNDNENRRDIVGLLEMTDSRQRDLNEAYTDEHTGQVDYTTPTWKNQTLEAGVKYIYRLNNSETTRQIDSLGTWIHYPSTSDLFKHEQHIYSGYLGYAFKFSKFGVKAGMRAEGTSLDVKYKLAPDMNFDKSYFDVVPNATFSYMLNMAQQLRLGYNLRIQRPGIWYLNPYVNTTNPTNISYGNSNLDTEKSHNINLNYSLFNPKFSINASTNYSFVNNSIERYTFMDDSRPGVLQSTYGNIGKNRRIGLFLYGNWNPIPLFRLYLNAGIDYTKIKSKALNLSNDGFSSQLYAGTQFNLPKDFRINLNGGYFTPRVLLQGENSAFYFTSISANKDLLKKKLTLSLSFQSPFWKNMKNESTTLSDNFYSKSTNFRSMREIRFSVSYRFGSLKEQIKKVRRSISNDDVKGGGGQGAETTTTPGS